MANRPAVSPARRAFAANGLIALTSLCLPRLALAQSAAAGAQAPSTGRMVSPDIEKANMAVVTEFCQAFVRKDAEKAASLLSDDCSYRIVQNRPAIVGKEKVTEQIKNLMERGAEFRIYKTAALGPLVVNDRDDTLQRPAGAITIRLTGFFFVENGKITEWTDYVVR